MRRAVLVLVLLARAAHAENDVAFDAALEAGVLLATHYTGTVSVAHRFWDDGAYVEGRLGAGTTGSLVVVGERIGAGLTFHPNRRIDLRVGWRVGHTYFGGSLNDAHLGVNLIAIELAVGIAIKVSPCWNLRVLPFGPTLYWNRVYAGTAGFELGVEHAF